MRRFLPLLAVLVLAACAAHAPGADPQGWKRYDGEKLGYSLALPADWRVDEENESMRYIGGTPTTVLSVFRSVEQFATIESALAARDKAAATGWEGKPSLKVLTTQTSKLGDETVVERREEYLAAGMTVVATYFLHDGRLYGFSSRPDGADVISDSQIMVHEQIMSTVRWL
jgi:hypothetical protein